MSLGERLLGAWYEARLSPWLWPMVPVALVFRALVALRRFAYRRGILRTEAMPVPVCVVGNLSVGGTGKTPLIIALAEAFARRGWSPGLVTRAYGAARQDARPIAAAGPCHESGDEALLLAATGLPVWAGRDRAAAAEGLLRAHPEVDVLFCDDGLQHYALARDVELVVVDAARAWGNGWLLPAGPLREPRSREREATATIWHTSAGAPAPSGPCWKMELEGEEFQQLVDLRRRAHAGDFADKRVVAVAGIGNPERFFRHLAHLGLVFEQHPFPDHHRFSLADLAFPRADVILMTAKDAVKCGGHSDPRLWVLPVRAKLPAGLVECIEEKLHGSKTA